MADSAVDLVSGDDNSDGKGSDDDSQVYVDKSEKKLSKPGKGKFTSAPRGEAKKVKDMSRKGSTTVAVALAVLALILKHRFPLLHRHHLLLQ